MKFLKNLIIFVIVVAVALAVISQFLPSSFRVERSLIIHAGADQIYPFVNDLRRWPEWTVWNTEADPTLVFTYEGPGEGVGASSKWESKKSGPGSLAITESDPAKGVKTELTFGRGGTPVQGWVTFAPAGTDTKVIFGFGGEVSRNPMQRWLYAYMDKMAGPEFEKNLAGLKKKVESLPRVTAP